MCLRAYFKNFSGLHQWRRQEFSVGRGRGAKARTYGWDSTPDPAGGAHSAPPDSVAGFKGPTSNRRGRRENEGRKREEETKEKGGGGGGGTGRGEGRGRVGRRKRGKRKERKEREGEGRGGKGNEGRGERMGER